MRCKDKNLLAAYEVLTIDYKKWLTHKDMEGLTEISNRSLSRAVQKFREHSFLEFKDDPKTKVRSYRIGTLLNQARLEKYLGIF